MRLIWKLLRQHISVVQLVGFFLANLIGLSIILCGVQLYSDVKPIVMGESLVSNDYLVLSKRVTTDNMFARETNRFSPEEIDRLKAQPFVERLGEFRSSQFRVSAEVSMFNASTLMFFESVPDSFLDIKSDKWHFTPGDKTIPIIIPRAYLNLYNFGFSPSMAIPQLSEEFLGEIPLQVYITTRVPSVVRYEARVVGFSERINTILVPDSFLSWANKEYGYTAMGGVSRVMVETSNPSDKAIGEYLAENGYHAEDNGSATSKMSYLLNIGLAVIVAIGAIFSILSLCILTLSIYLLLQKNTKKLENLVLAGYTPRVVAMPYKLLTALLNVVVAGGAVGAALLVRLLYVGKLSALFGQAVGGSTVSMVVSGVVIACVVMLLNMRIIQRKVDKIAR